MKKGAKTRGRRRQRRRPTAKTKPPPREKRVKATQPEPQYVEKQRNLQDLWKAAKGPSGIGWTRSTNKTGISQISSANLKKGESSMGLGTTKSTSFGATETSSPSLPVLIPTLVAVVAPRPPSMEIGIRSVQREGEEIVPMKQMKMDWIPYLLNPNDEAEEQSTERLRGGFQRSAEREEVKNKG